MITSHLMCANFFMIKMLSMTSESNSHFHNNNLNEEGTITSHLICVNFSMINLNVIITFMLQGLNNNRETLAKHVT